MGKIWLFLKSTGVWQRAGGRNDEEREQRCCRGLLSITRPRAVRPMLCLHPGIAWHCPAARGWRRSVGCAAGRQIGREIQGTEKSLLGLKYQHLWEPAVCSQTTREEPKPVRRSRAAAPAPTFQRHCSLRQDASCPAGWTDGRGHVHFAQHHQPMKPEGKRHREHRGTLHPRDAETSRRVKPDGCGLALPAGPSAQLIPGCKGPHRPATRTPRG